MSEITRQLELAKAAAAGGVNPSPEFYRPQPAQGTMGGYIYGGPNKTPMPVSPEVRRAGTVTIELERLESSISLLERNLGMLAERLASIVSPSNMQSPCRDPETPASCGLESMLRGMRARVEALSGVVSTITDSIEI